MAIRLNLFACCKHRYDLPSPLITIVTGPWRSYEVASLILSLLKHSIDPPSQDNPTPPNNFVILLSQSKYIQYLKKLYHPIWKLCSTSKTPFLNSSSKQSRNVRYPPLNPSHQEIVNWCPSKVPVRSIVVKEELKWLKNPLIYTKNCSTLLPACPPIISTTSLA